MGDQQNLSSQEAIAKLKTLAEDIKMCMFCTDLTTTPFATRPMGLQQVDEQGNLWFISSASSNKNAEIKADEKVQLLFAKPSDSHYLSIYGDAFIYTDRNTIEEMWTPMANAWFDGKEDPDVTVIRISPSEAYYWDTKYGKMVSMLKIAAAAVTGKTMDGGVEGSLNV